MKAGKDPLINYRNRLEDLDIKVVIPYVIGVTTHVVCTKRNTAKGLQALINGQYIVTESYIDALVYATTPENLDELESLSPLEEDFDANWPNALEHLPAKSKEPGERPPSDFAPDPLRGNVFEGYTFVFLDATQFETLQAPITNGGGKAVSFIPEPGKTTTEEVVRHVKSVAGEKGLGEFEDGSEGKGVVVVRFRLKENFADWAVQMDTTISLALGQRLIEQSEFIEAILLNDASILRRPLEVDYEESEPKNNATGGPARLAEDVSHVEAPARSEVPMPAPRRARVRGHITSRFKGFGADDSDDESSLPTTSRPAAFDSQMESVPRSERSQRYTNGASLADSAMDDNSQRQEHGEQEAVNPKKRPASAFEEMNDEEMMDNLLPAAAAMKRRRIEEAESSRQNERLREPSLETSQNSSLKKKTPQPPKEINIKDALRERREKEEAAQRDEENTPDDVGGMSIEEMKKLAVVETMEIPNRPERTRRREKVGPTDSRWDERWNGRKNFKKFRRQGEGTQARRGQSVIVPLEEAKRKDYGIGDDYWLYSETTTRNKREEKGRAAHSQSQQSQPFASAKSEVLEVPPELAVNGNLPDSIDIETPRMTRRQEQSQQKEESSGSRFQAVNGKRPAISQASGGPAKKQKVFAAVQDSDSDSEDELKFRFKKKGR